MSDELVLRDVVLAGMSEFLRNGLTSVRTETFVQCLCEGLRLFVEQNPLHPLASQLIIRQGDVGPDGKMTYYCVELGAALGNVLLHQSEEFPHLGLGTQDTVSLSITGLWLMHSPHQKRRWEGPEVQVICSTIAAEATREAQLSYNYMQELQALKHGLKMRFAERSRGEG